MAEQVRVVVDAMGGDNAPAEPVRAAVEAVTERQDNKSNSYRKTGSDR